MKCTAARRTKLLYAILTKYIAQMLGDWAAAASIACAFATRTKEKKSSNTVPPA
jgi:hypothetical protein